MADITTLSLVQQATSAAPEPKTPGPIDRIVLNHIIKT
jgi:hypothetical protein